ncbi:MAG: hypothetical protein Q4D58_12160 [Synergistaceae bacterium]|nr:hypothetical protein [Synergistaceae bacterium]
MEIKTLKEEINNITEPRRTNEIPDSNTFRRIFERLNLVELSKCLLNWLKVEREKRSVIAVDGKAIGARKR